MTGERTEAQTRKEIRQGGWVNGVLFCYGGCGFRYEDFPLDVSLPTPLWNRIAVGPPFDESQSNIEREGRGGVLCANCIVDRLARLTKATVALLTTDEHESSVRAQAPDIPAGEQ